MLEGKSPSPPSITVTFASVADRRRNSGTFLFFSSTPQPRVDFLNPRFIVSGNRFRSVSNLSWALCGAAGAGVATGDGGQAKVANAVCKFFMDHGAPLYKSSREGCLESRDTMTLDDYILTVFCLIDDQLAALHLDHLRQRGSAPLLHDSEVRTIELVGEFLGLDQDARLFWYFR